VYPPEWPRPRLRARLMLALARLAARTCDPESVAAGVLILAGFILLTVLILAAMAQ
jgi:hypothetical protein